MLRENKSPSSSNGRFTIHISYEQGPTQLTSGTHHGKDPCVELDTQFTRLYVCRINAIVIAELLLTAILFLLLGIYIGVYVSIRILNRSFIDKLADESVNKAYQTASSIRCLCEDYVYRIIKNTQPFPYATEDTLEYIKRRINLN